MAIVVDDGLYPQSVEMSNGSGVPVLKVERDSGSGIELKIYYPQASDSSSMSYLFVYHPEQSLTPIHLVTEGHGM
ncbi:hypothetical protein GGH91_000744, partial [Coemansia sp. RSA 2671]